jgi:type VI secretion system secreted protein Hcp
MAATDIFIKIDGIKGESHDAKHAGEIDVLSWSFGAQQTGAGHGGGGSGAGKVSIGDLQFVKRADTSSTALLLACCAGTHIKDAVLTVRKAGDKPLEFMQLKLSDVLVSSFQEGGSHNADSLPVENVSLNFAKVEVIYKEQDNTTGAQKGGDFKMGWDVKKNVKV